MLVLLFIPEYDVNTLLKHLGLKMKTDEAIAHYGGVKELAASLGIWPHVVYRWGASPPMARQYEIEVKTEGLLKAERGQG